MDLPTEPQPFGSADLPAPVAPPARPGFWSGLGMVALYFVMQVAVGFVVGVVLAIGYAVIAAAQGRKVTGETIMHWIQAPDGKVVLTVITLLVVAALMLWMIRRRWATQWGVARPPGFGFVMPANHWFFLWAVLLAVVWAIGGAYLTEALAHGHPIQQDVTLMGSGVALGMRLLLAVVVVGVAPVVEEALFRGVLLSGLMRSIPAGWAVLVSAVIFGGVHYPDFGFVWYALPTLMAGGVLLGWIRLRSRSLWPSITMHATNNLVAVVGWFVLTGAHG